MAIETSYMKYGHSSSPGLVGQEMKPETMKTWAYSLYVCYEMVAGLEFMQNKETNGTERYKEESKNRTAHDKNDRDNIRSKLESLPMYLTLIIIQKPAL